MDWSVITKPALEYVALAVFGAGGLGTAVGVYVMGRLQARSAAAKREDEKARLADEVELGKLRLEALKVTMEEELLAARMKTPGPEKLARATDKLSRATPGTHSQEVLKEFVEEGLSHTKAVLAAVVTRSSNPGPVEPGVAVARIPAPALPREARPKPRIAVPPPVPRRKP